MNYEFYYKNKDNEPYKVIFYEGKRSINKILDQINLGEFNIITKSEFILLTENMNLMTIDIRDEFTDIKIGEITLEEEDLSNIDVIG